MKQVYCGVSVDSEILYLEDLRHLLFAQNFGRQKAAFRL